MPALPKSVIRKLAPVTYNPIAQEPTLKLKFNRYKEGGGLLELYCGMSRQGVSLEPDECQTLAIGLLQASAIAA